MGFDLITWLNFTETLHVEWDKGGEVLHVKIEPVKVEEWMFKKYEDLANCDI